MCNFRKVYGKGINIKYAIVLILLTGCATSLNAQRDTTPRRFLRSYELGLQHGFIFAHSEAVQNTRGANPTGVELSMSWQRSDAAAWELCRCFPKKGLLLAYYDYDTRILGRSFTAAWFLEPYYRLNDRLFFSLRAAGGASYLTSPFDSLRNPTNMSYSTRFSGYLLLGTGVWIRLGDHWWLGPTINYQHVSNGGSKQPNKGINWPTAGLSLGYRPGKQSFYNGPRTRFRETKERNHRYDLVVSGNARRSLDTNGDSRRVALLGVGAQAARQVGRINNLTASIELYYDEVTNRMLKQDSVSASAFKAQLAFGHEFLLGRFIFSQRLGVYVFDQTPYNDIIFHRWGLLYRINPRWSAGFNLQAHRHIAEFIDLRLVYSRSRVRQR